MLLTTCLAAADERQNTSLRAIAMNAADGPSRFDFLVLASLADSPHLLAMADYRPAPRHCAARPVETAARQAAGGKLPQCRL